MPALSARSTPSQSPSVEGGILDTAALVRRDDPTAKPSEGNAVGDTLYEENEEGDGLHKDVLEGDERITS